MKGHAKPTTVVAWQDDPKGYPDDSRPIPDLSKAPLKYRIKGPAIKPGTYAHGTAEFRYWAAAEALRRGADFWAPKLGVAHWQPGSVLAVGLDEGDDLNAYYDRTELAFFHHQTPDGTVVYSGESPDVACHEMGHACLDAHRPELWDAPFIEAGAFHESFGDMSAILSALQLESVRTAALNGVKSNKASPLSRLAEQLGWAIRQVDPGAVNSDCLRNACNNFNYVDPSTLPDSAPAKQLCAEVHSFSRIFTGAFYEILSGMLRIRSKTPTQSDLAAIATDAALLLMDATTAAPVQPNYFAQVAAHMIDADTARFAGKYRAALVDTFVKRKIVPAAATTALINSSGKIAKLAFGIADRQVGLPPSSQIHTVELKDKRFGLGERTLKVEAPFERRSFLSMSASIAHDVVDPKAHVEQATHRFVKMLFAHNRVDTSTRKRLLANDEARGHERRRMTHVVLKSGSDLKLVRRKFDCCG